ncbi:MAG: Uma2 family endonuclease [Jatrophihabitantaceae bacterium]
MVVRVQSVVEAQQVWTFDDLLALPEDADRRRYEVVDGSLVVSPSATPRHELASEEVRAAIRASLPIGFKVVGPLAVDLHPSYRVPDLLVVPLAIFGENSPLARPADVLLVVEVVSPGSETTDRVTKPAQYAAAGIGAFWRVETDPVSLTAYTLPAGAGTYTELGSWAAGQIARIESPFPVEIALDSLTPPR